MDNFKKNLKVQTISEEERQNAIKKYKENQMEKYQQFYNNKKIQK